MSTVPTPDGLVSATAAVARLSDALLTQSLREMQVYKVEVMDTAAGDKAYPPPLYAAYMRYLAELASTYRTKSARPGFGGAPGEQAAMVSTAEVVSTGRRQAEAQAAATTAEAERTDEVVSEPSWWDTITSAPGRLLASVTDRLTETGNGILGLGETQTGLQRAAAWARLVAMFAVLSGGGYLAYRAIGAVYSASTGNFAAGLAVAAPLLRGRL